MKASDIIAAGTAAAAALRAGQAYNVRSLPLQAAHALKNTTSLMQLAETAAAQGQSVEAVSMLERAVDASPASPGPRFRLAQLLLQIGRPDAALDHMAHMSMVDRRQFEVQALEAAILGILGRHDPEIALYEDLVSRNPTHAPLWKSLGDALKYAGRVNEGVDALRRAVSLQPGYGEGWWSLANVKSARFADADLAAMRKALRASNTPDEQLHLHFALGKALEDRARYAVSFKHYDAGNRLRASALTPAQMSVTSLVDHLIRSFDAETMARVGKVGHPSNEPIFVVGLQRSGSTLIEQILASHPAIEGTSELLAMQQLWNDFTREAAANRRTLKEHLLAVSADDLSEIGASYLKRTQPFRHEGKARFVDKLPANWIQTAFIRLVFPNACIIDARRHPMACGFSNFKQHYAAGVTFAYSQESIARFYRDYLRMMRHLRAIDPGSAHLAINEHLIENTEAEVRALLDFVKVPFDPACLSFHRTIRPVNTPSAEQVRRPINREGMNYWKHYAPWLGPMREELGPDLSYWVN